MRERGLELSQEKTIITRVEDGFDFLGQTVRKYPNGKVLTTVTLERRRGPTIAAAGIQRAPVRSSHSHVVKGRALRWVRLLLLVPIPWAGRTGALPFLTVLAPSARYDQEHNRRHKAVPRWARQLVFLLHRWSPERPLVVVGDQDDAVLELLAAVRPVATVVTRLRLDARLFDPPRRANPIRKGAPVSSGAACPPWPRASPTPRRSGPACASRAGPATGRRLPSPCGAPPGPPSRPPRSALLWPSCAAPCGHRPLFACRPRERTS